MKKKTPTKKKTVKRIKKEEVIEKTLTDKQKLFCHLYVTDKWCFGNATQSYIEAYNLTGKSVNSARQNGYRLIANDYIRTHLNKLLDEAFKETYVDRELASVIKQNKDIRSKVAGISEFNKLQNRIKEAPTTGPITIHIAPEVAAKMR